MQKPTIAVSFKTNEQLRENQTNISSPCEDFCLAADPEPFGIETYI